MKTLDQLKIKETAVISAVGGEGHLRQHLLDMGMIPGTQVTLIKFAPMGDPMEVRIHDYELTLRRCDAQNITVIPKKEDTYASEKQVQKQITALLPDHPGLGETGIFHEKETEHPLPQGELLTFALMGNQNCGKTTLFNQLTGSNQHVGNFPGVTVDRKDGSLRGRENTLVTDLPGIYSMSPYTNEELVSRRFVLEEKPKGIINIVDATNIERNLYLTLQLIELDIPMVLALNMMDEVRENGGTILVNALEASLGIPVIPISAAKNEGISELIDHALHVAKYQEKPLRQDFCEPEGKSGAVHRCLHGIMHLIEDHAISAGISPRFAAGKLVEGDPLILELLSLDHNEEEMLEHIIVQMETESGLDRQAAMADMRFDYICRLCEETVVKPARSKERVRSEKIDRLLTGKYTAIPTFLLIMSTIFILTFQVIGLFFQNLLELGIEQLCSLVVSLMEKGNVNATLQSLIADGILGGVGSVISFLPIILTLFFFLSLLEDSGYMARVAFVMDKLLRKLGLSGQSIVPMLIGFGCTVPGVMASRTLSSSRDRKMTILLTPFMSCSAKMPIYSFLCALFFPGYAGLVMCLLYFGSIFVGILIALILKRVHFRGEAVPFVMELPNYRFPGIKNVTRLLWDKAKDFLQRAFSVIFLATILIWVLQTFDPGLNVAASPKESILSLLAGLISPLFAPLGFGDYRISTSLLTGFIAKESVVSTLSVLYGTTTALTEALSLASCISLLVFCLLYTPCVAAIAAVKRELGWRWALFMVVFQCALAWLLSFFAYHIALFFL